MRRKIRKKRNNLLIPAVVILVGIIFLGGLFLKKSKTTISSQIVDTSPKIFFENQLKLAGIELGGDIIETEKDLEVTLSSGTKLLVKKKFDYSAELASLQLILQNIRIEGRWPLKIDLRFQRPVLGY